jgi:hypothetical protein
MSTESKSAKDSKETRIETNNLDFSKVVERIPLLIGLNGYKGVGKDAAADYLVREYGYRKVAFANKLKESVAALFDISLHEMDKLKNDPECDVSLSPLVAMTFREFIQRYGTESHRDVFGEDFWVNQLLPKDYIEGKVFPTVVSDARFENELQRIKDLGGINIRIARPGYEGEAHASEQAPPDGLIYTLIQNDGSFDLLCNRVDLALIQWAHIDDGIWD